MFKPHQSGLHSASGSMWAGKYIQCSAHLQVLSGLCFLVGFFLLPCACVQVWATVSMWMASVSTLHACKSRVFRSAYQTQMAVFPPRTCSEIPRYSVVCPTWDYNLSEPCLLTTWAHHSTVRQVRWVLSGSGSRPCSQDLPSPWLNHCPRRSRMWQHRKPTGSQVLSWTGCQE